MNRTLLLVIFLATFTSWANSQNELSKWYFGDYAALDFMTDPPTPLTGSAMYITIGCSSIADAAGNLLFYTDGGTIWNSSHLTMANGTGLLGNQTASQSCLIVKKPLSNSIYYVFTVQGLAGPAGLNYSVVDMSLAAGQGSVTLKNIPLFPSPCSSKIAGTYHCNGQDVWVVTHEYGNANFRSYLVSSAGVNTTAIISSVGSVHNISPLGTLKISSAGRKLAVVNSPSNQGDLQLFEFNISTGIVTNPLTLLGPGAIGAYPRRSCEFSPDNKLLYAVAGGKIWQWNICASDSAAILSSVYVFTPSVTITFESMQLAINEKLYVANTGPDNICVINNPNMVGAACNIVYNGQSVAPNKSNDGLPNHFLRYRHKLTSFTFSLSTGVACRAVSFTSAPMPTVTCAASNYSVKSMMWDFGDPASGQYNTTSVLNPLHNYSASGNYTVMQILYYNCGSDTLRQVVAVPPPDLTVTATPGCENTGGTASVNVGGGSGNYSYTWSPSQNTGTLVSGLISGTHTVSVNDHGLNCAASATVALVNISVPVVSPQPSSINLCEGSTVVMSAGSDAQNFSWQPQAGLSIAPNGELTVFSTISQVYTITASNGSCTGSGTLSVTLVALPSPTISASQPKGCAGSNITFTASGGKQYLWWLPDNTWRGGEVLSTLLPTTSPANFTLVAKNEQGCEKTINTSVQVVPAPSGSLKGFSPEACAPFCGNFPFTAANGTKVSSLWSIQGQQSRGAALFCLPDAGTYTLTGLLTDSLSQCTASLFTEITLYKKPVATFSYSPQRITEKFDEVRFSGSADPNSGFTHEWYIYNGNMIFTSRKREFDYVFEDPGTYPVAYVISDNRGCADTSVVPVLVHSPTAIYVPNSFSPNSDGRNDYFKPVMTGIIKYHLQVFDRWGHLVFATENPNLGWNGTSNGMSCPQGVYVWKISATTVEGEPETKNGHVTLLR